MVSFPLFTEEDPSEVVADEVIGFAVAMFGIGHAGWSYALGFILFRFFDILKPPPVRQTERVPGGAGIVLDDIMAGKPPSFCGVTNR